MLTSQRATSAGRIATLDGWRGIAIVLVLMEHAASDSSYRDYWWARLGYLGVDIFFVLSGYIITSRLLEEEKKAGSISLRGFYLRRAFRILPLVMTYLAAVSVLSLFRDVDVHPSQVLGALFFFRNYQVASHSVGVPTGHFWSLSVEEHFYLFWPLLLLLNGRRRSLAIALVGALACGNWRFYDSAHPDSFVGRWLPGVDASHRILRTDARLDGLLLGCAVAILLEMPSVRAFVARNFPKELPLICAVLFFFNLSLTGGYPTLANYLIIAVGVACTLVVEEGLAFKWLNTRLLVWIGTISYSLYVWQQVFIYEVRVLRPLGVLNMFPYNFVALAAVASLSFYCLEKPLIRYGRRFGKMGEIQPVAAV